MVCIATQDQVYTIRRIVYTVESASIPGRTYEVVCDDDGWTCSCKAREFTKTRGRCWHLKAAIAGELPGKPKVTLGVAPQPTPAPAVDPRIAAVAILYGAD